MKKSIKKYQDGSLIKGSPDIYNFLVRYGVVDPNTTTPEQIQALPPDQLKEMVKLSGLPDTKSVQGEVIAQRPLEVTQKNVEKKITFEEAFAAAPEGSVFIWEGKPYKKEFDPKGKPKKSSMTEDEMKVSFVTNKLSSLQYGGSVNNTGYTPGTPTYGNPFNIIPSSSITMRDTPFDIIGISDKGEIKKMKAGGENYQFKDASYVVEIPNMQQGGLFGFPLALSQKVKQVLQNKQGVESPVTNPSLRLDSAYADSSLKSIYDLLQSTPGLENTMVDPNLKLGSMLGGSGFKTNLLAMSGLMNLQMNQGNTANNVDLSSQMINAYQMGGAPMQQPPQGLQHSQMLQPIQAETSKGQDEFIRLSDGRLTPVKSDMSHKEMSDTDITDILTPGSYVASADKKMSITRKEASKFPINIEIEDYKEGEKTDKPEINMLDKYIFKGKESKITPAKAFERVQKKFPIIEGTTDPYTKKSNEENAMSRDKILNSIIMLSESKKPKAKGEIIPKAQPGYNYGYNPNGIVPPSYVTNPGIYGYPTTAPYPGIGNIDPYSNLPGISTTNGTSTASLQNRNLPSGAPNTYSSPSAPSGGKSGSTNPVGLLVSIGGQIVSAIQNARTAKDLRREMGSQQVSINNAYDETRSNLQNARTTQLLGNLALNTDRVDTTLSDSAYQNINPTAQRNALDAVGSRTLGSLTSSLRNNPYLDKIGRQAMTAQAANQLYDNMFAGTNKYFEQRFLRDKGVMDTANTNTGLRAQEDKRVQTLRNQQTANSFSTLASSYTDKAALNLNQAREINQLRLQGILGPAAYNQAIAQNIVSIGNDINGVGDINIGKLLGFG